MNYYGPRQNATTGKYDYTCRNDNKIWAVGYCADAGGNHHDTESEACVCYRRWLLDNTMRLDCRNAGTFRKCEHDGCDVLTDRYAQVDQTWLACLCDEHRTKEIVETRFPPVHTRISSW